TLAVVVVVGLALVGWLAVAAGASIVSYGGYRLTRRHDVLRVRRGLLDQREASIELHRVQAVWIRENPARRALGLVSVTIQSAGGAAGADGGDARIDVPILARRDLGGLLAEVLPAAAEPPPLLPPPPAARRRAWVRSVGPVALLVVAVGTAVLLLDAAPSVVAAFGVAAVLALAGAATAAEVGFAARGWTATPELVVAREGGLIRVTALVPSAKVQSTRLRSSPFQRRVDLATLALDVAGRGDTPRILDVEVDRLERLRLDALAAPAARRDEGAVRRGP
ncbi:MAG: PH domain-containing protein, partial [Acidimicrobiales bacterium]|nr:PH domain-containing protein [Acidimicrobiales bacterium]